MKQQQQQEHRHDHHLKDVPHHGNDRKLRSRRDGVVQQQHHHKRRRRQRTRMLMEQKGIQQYHDQQQQQQQREMNLLQYNYGSPSSSSSVVESLLVEPATTNMMGQNFQQHHDEYRRILQSSGTGGSIFIESLIFFALMMAFSVCIWVACRVSCKLLHKCVVYITGTDYRHGPDTIPSDPYLYQPGGGRFGSNTIFERNSATGATTYTIRISSSSHHNNDDRNSRSSRYNNPERRSFLEHALLKEDYDPNRHNAEENDDQDIDTIVHNEKDYNQKCNNIDINVKDTVTTTNRHDKKDVVPSNDKDDENDDDTGYTENKTASSSSNNNDDNIDIVRSSSNNTNSCNHNNVNACAICLDEYQRGDQICRSFNGRCRHIFHHGCILDWLMTEDTCPCCRQIWLGFYDGGDETTNNDNDNDRGEVASRSAYNSNNTNNNNNNISSSSSSNYMADVDHAQDPESIIASAIRRYAGAYYDQDHDVRQRVAGVFGDTSSSSHDRRRSDHVEVEMAFADARNSNHYRDPLSQQSSYPGMDPPEQTPRHTGVTRTSSNSSWLYGVVSSLSGVVSSSSTTNSNNNNNNSHHRYSDPPGRRRSNASEENSFIFDTANRGR